MSDGFFPRGILVHYFHVATEPFLDADMKYPGFVVVVVLGAVACHGDRSYSAGPSSLIQDGGHPGGNAFFFWLPPITNQQPPAGQVFSRQLTPTVTITNLCSGDVIRTLAGSEVQVEDAQYHANWHTPDDNLDPACTYRIAVQTGARQLGVVDVDVVDDGSELKNVDTDEFIPLLDDRTLPIQFFIGVGSQCERTDSDCGEGTAQPGVSTTIVTENGQAGVVIPAGAVDQPVTIIVESSDDRPCIASLLEPVYSGSIGPIGNSCYDFHTEPPLAEINASGRFNTNVTVGICADLGSLDHATRDLLRSCSAIRRINSWARVLPGWGTCWHDSGPSSCRDRYSPRQPRRLTSAPAGVRTSSAALRGRCRVNST